jgi:hypothetical protein
MFDSPDGPYNRFLIEHYYTRMYDHIAAGEQRAAAVAEMLFGSGGDCLGDGI